MMTHLESRRRKLKADRSLCCIISKVLDFNMRNVLFLGERFVFACLALMIISTHCFAKGGISPRAYAIHFPWSQAGVPISGIVIAMVAADNFIIFGQTYSETINGVRLPLSGGQGCRSTRQKTTTISLCVTASSLGDQGYSVYYVEHRDDTSYRKELQHQIFKLRFNISLGAGYCEVSSPYVLYSVNGQESLIHSLKAIECRARH